MMVSTFPFAVIVMVPSVSFLRATFVLVTLVNGRQAFPISLDPFEHNYEYVFAEVVPKLKPFTTTTTCILPGSISAVVIRMDQCNIDPISHF